MTDDSFELRPFLRKLSNRARLPFFRMHIHVGACDVQIAANHECAGFRMSFGNELFQRIEESHLRGEILPTVRDVDGDNADSWQTCQDDPVLVVKRWVFKDRPLGRDMSADMKCHT